jgi:cytochrome c oxidase subunit 3
MVTNQNPAITEDLKERKRIHPQKFMMWIAIASITMAFAGLTSGYMVREAQGNWRYYALPSIFWYSTIPIVISSLTIMLSIKAYKKSELSKSRGLLAITLLLGVIFGLMQMEGFYQLYHQMQHIRINGQVLNEMSTVRLNGNPSESFLFIIAGLHLVHLAGGIIALFIVFFTSFRKTQKPRNSVPMEITATYWHFVDVLWLYLFVFFLVNQ